MSNNFFEEASSFRVVFEDTEFESNFTETVEDQPIPKPAANFTTFEQILRDTSLARQMHSPDYFLLVE